MTTHPTPHAPLPAHLATGHVATADPDGTIHVPLHISTDGDEPPAHIDWGMSYHDALKFAARLDYLLAAPYRRP